MDDENLSLTSRVQKITEALYRVTDLLPDKEPLKWTLRNNAIEIFNSLTAEEIGFPEGNPIFGISSSISRICRFLELAFSSTAFVSTINFEILRREYLVLADLIEKKKQESKSLKNLLPLFEGQISPPTGGSNGHHNGQQSNGHIRYKGQKDKDRQKQILEFIKTNNWTTIRTISSALPQFGPKSIQRDLLEMVGSGILNKTGDKRWRKYGIN